MTGPLSKTDVARLKSAFRMPAVQTMMSRKSSVTNAFVNALIPVIEPDVEEIAKALNLLAMTPDDVRCAYCGDPASEWDHLRPLVMDRRPTGYISEIANLVPSCGKCNQSKGNKNWLAWMRSDAPRAPARRGVADIEQRIERLKAYETWKHIQPIDFEKILGPEEYRDYWENLDRVVDSMRECQQIANELKRRILDAHLR